MQFFKKLKNFVFNKWFVLNLVLIGLAWVLIVFGGKWYFSLFTSHGQKVEVPTLINNNVQDVPALIGDRKLQYEIIDSVYNPDLLEGTVIYQNPMPTDTTGMAVKEGRVIRIRVSKRTRLVNVPIVKSKSERFAIAMLTAKGLRTKIKYVSSNEDQGSVIKQQYQGKDVNAGDLIPINSVIELTVGKRSDGTTINVPNLVGLTIKEAESRFKSSSLKLFVVCNDCITASDSLNAVIKNQTPIAADSSRVPEGTTITVFGSIAAGFSDGLEFEE